MKVKEHWSRLSEQIMYEWSLSKPTAYNRAKTSAYAYWQSVKDLDMTQLRFEDTLRLCKIEENQMIECKRPAFRRR